MKALRVLIFLVLFLFSLAFPLGFCDITVALVVKRQASYETIMSSSIILL